MSVQTKQLTLVMVLSEARKQVLLGLKKRGFGVNKWNGYGGKVEANETIAEGAARELLEESTLRVNPDNLTKRAVFNFTFDDKKDKELHVHVYSVDSSLTSGEPEETEEMRPAWYDYDSVPYKDMWADDEQWYPFLFAGKNFKGSFHFDNDTILKQNLEVVNTENMEDVPVPPPAYLEM